ncbi:YugN family protein [Alteribacillus iranensis]|uniref:YugN-like family protein n=1 Tax=Alteribacillus iranensis TaxID=930128 RepID=A0A1I2AGC4_9BACI|nr:YugN family protein [Alteribacillus iranensis]SFE42043.1 YugN-like family protein [Alteribacillus iranensis]
MDIKGFDFEGREYSFGNLTRIMEKHGFIHAEQWDYERVTYDYKMLDESDDATYYLRVQAFAIEGEIPQKNAKVQLLTPMLGRHYYPHGIEYDEEFPDKIARKSTSIIEGVHKELFDAEEAAS